MKHFDALFSITADQTPGVLLSALPFASIYEASEANTVVNALLGDCDTGDLSELMVTHGPDGAVQEAELSTGFATYDAAQDHARAAALHLAKTYGAPTVCAEEGVPAAWKLSRDESCMVLLSGPLDPQSEWESKGYVKVSRTLNMRDYEG